MDNHWILHTGATMQQPAQRAQTDVFQVSILAETDIAYREAANHLAADLTLLYAVRVVLQKRGAEHEMLGLEVLIE